MSNSKLLENARNLRSLPDVFATDMNCVEVDKTEDRPNIYRNYQKGSLPTLLLKGIQAFQTDEEQTLYLYLSLAAISGLLVKVKGTYRNQQVSPNLYCAGIARPASGKGLVTFVQQQLYKVHQEFLEQSLNDYEKYRLELKEFNKQKKNDPSAIVPKRSPFKVVFIPANVTSAKLQQHLQDNQADGIVPQILIDAEIDSLVGSMESDLANISSILRKAFHGETISMSRKTDNEYLEIRDCQLSLALTGTANQFVKLVNNKSDGLMSRFLVYMIDKPPSVQGIRRCLHCPDIKSTFRNLADQYYEFFKFMERGDFVVELSDEQLEMLEHFLSEQLEVALDVYGDDAAQIVLRHGLMLFKICQVFTSLRKFETHESVSSMTCLDDDFGMALHLIQKSIQNSLRFFTLLPEDKHSFNYGRQHQFLDGLPVEFTRKLALEHGLTCRVTEPTVDRRLKELTMDGLIVHDSRGFYKKVERR